MHHGLRWRARVRHLALAALLSAFAAGVSAPPTSAATSGSRQSPGSGGARGHGWDISWPQCPSHFPTGGAFAVVGVTNGLPWNANPCLAAEYSWAAGLANPPGLYMNTANPAPHSSYYWPTSGSSDPALCKDATITTDPGCAYDYGWHAAANALTTAKAVISVTAATTHAWWLDAEIGNTWNGDGYSNAADLQGSIDYLRSSGVPSVGVYSTGYQWGAITGPSAVTGGYSLTSAPTYAAAWRPEFTSAYGIAASPDWVAGATARTAAAFCTHSFTGVAVQLTQYHAQGFDADHHC